MVGCVGGMDVFYSNFLSQCAAIRSSGHQETSLYRFSVCSFELARCQRASGDGLGRGFEDEKKDLGGSWSQKSLKEQKRVLYNGDRISLC